MKVRAKFFVASINHIHTGGDTVCAEVRMLPTFEGAAEPEHLEGENARFSKATPSGELKMTITNPVALERLDLGAFYYLTIERVPDAPVSSQIG